jgi:hypothetical protein
MKWEGNVARVWDMRNSTYIHNVGLKPLRRPSCRREDNIKTDRKKQMLNGAQNRAQRPAFATSQNLRGGTEENFSQRVGTAPYAAAAGLTATIPCVSEGGEH